MYKKLLLTLCLLCSTEAMATKYALIVGVADYKNSKDDLPGIDKDLTKIYKLLKSWHFDVKVLRGADTLKLDEHLKKYAYSLKKDDTFAFYYTGHGSYVEDKNNDEADGRDETLVLSDGKEDKHYLDDDLNYRLNAIKAKKLIVFDSCHSGTAHKAGTEGFVSKSMFSDLVPTLFKREKKRDEPVYPNNLTGSFVKLSASKDSETSVATKEGSLFTTQLIKLLKKKKFQKKSLKNIRQNVSYEIGAICNKKKLTKFSPVFDASSEDLLSGSILDFLAAGGLVK